MNRPVFPPVPFFAALAALAAYASAFLLLRMADYGPVISWDAAHYISIARNLLHGSGYVAANGDPASAWAPLWPILLAAIGALASVDPRDAAGPLNAVSLGLCVFVAGAWMRRNLDSRFLVVWGCLVVALSPSLTLHSTRALTETMFVLFATLALVCLDRRLAEGGRPWLLWAAVFTGLAWSTRYVGVVVAVAAIAALALRRGVPAPDKAKEIVLFSLISAAPVGAWAMRNLLVTGSFFAPPQPVDLAWWEVVEGILKSTGALLVDPQSGSGFRKTFGGLALLSLAAALAVGVARTKAQGERCDSWRSLRLFGGFVVLFVCFYAWTVFNGNTWHGAQARHLLPVYIPLLFAGLLAADRFLARERKRPPAPGAGKTSWIGGGGTKRSLWLAGVLSLWVVWNAPAHSIGALRGSGAHEGYPFDYRDSEVMRWLRDNPSDATLYSNDVYAVYIAGTDGAGDYRHLPASRPVGRIIGDGDPRDMLVLFLERARNGDRLVWLLDNSGNRLFDYDLADLRASAGLRIVADLADGAVFEVNKPAGGGDGQ